VKIQYKNETSALVNIRGKKLLPGESIVSQVFIRPFDEFVKKGELTIYVDGVKIDFEQAPVIEAQIANDDSGAIPADAGANLDDGERKLAKALSAGYGTDSSPDAADTGDKNEAGKESANEAGAGSEAVADGAGAATESEEE
jgi:hypothetical protein